LLAVCVQISGRFHLPAFEWRRRNRMSDTKQEAKDKLKTGDSADDVFYPTDYVIAAFENQSLLNDARDALRHAGFADNDVIVLDAQGMRSLGRDQAREESSNPFKAVKAFISNMGDDSDYVLQYQELAQRGYVFLLAYAPDDDKTTRVTQAIKPFKPERARKYASMSVTDLYPEVSGL
jgi:hypothetical protein